jgi:hypothetical protein
LYLASLHTCNQRTNNLNSLLDNLSNHNQDSMLLNHNQDSLLLNHNQDSFSNNLGNLLDSNKDNLFHSKQEDQFQFRLSEQNLSS